MKLSKQKSIDQNNLQVHDILNFIQKKDMETKRKGKLKIFFGMLPGVGKTTAMLQEAQAQVTNGSKVVVGFIECNTRPATQEMVDSLPIIPPKEIRYNGEILQEMNVEAIIKTHPDLVVVYDFAHNNAPGSRNAKRYQDVQELLDAGIDVYTILSVVNLESCHKEACQIADMTFTRVLPDEIFEKADEVEFIDINPGLYLTRLKEGKVNMENQSAMAIRNLSYKEKISTLRKMAYRKVSEREDKQQARSNWPPETRQHILVLIRPTEASKPLIRRTQTMATLMDAEWSALYIESDSMLDEEAREQLADNIYYVSQLKGNVISASGNDRAKICLEVIQRENVTHVILGQDFIFEGKKKNFVKKLAEQNSHVNIYIVGTAVQPKNKYKNLFTRPLIKTKLSEYMMTVVASILTALICVPLAKKTGYLSVSMLMVLVLFVLANFMHIGPVILATIMGVLGWLFFFHSADYPDYFVDHPSDVIAIVVFFVIVFLNGLLTFRVREQKTTLVDRERKTNALLRLTEKFSNATNISDVVEASVENIRKYFAVDAFFIFCGDDHQLTDTKYIPKEIALSVSELEVANWAFKYNQNAGKYTTTFPSATYTYYSLRGLTLKSGVLAVQQREAFTGKTAVFWDAFLSQVSQATEHQHLVESARKMDLVNESERLYKTLFNSISHELRIPVATIMGASDTLLVTHYPEEIKKELYSEMFKASKRLNRLIENLLNMSRIEAGRIIAQLDWCDIHDLVNRVLESLSEELQIFRVVVSIPKSMPLIKLDFGLMEQVLYNLIYNSCQYASAGTTICIKAYTENNMLILEEMDKGAGFEPDAHDVFNKFYRGKDSKTGGLGLGLSIVKGFVEAHKGLVSVKNRQGGGAHFIIQIPTEVAYENENENGNEQ